MVVSVLSFLAGILVIQQFHELPGIQWILAILGFAGILASFRCWRFFAFAMGLAWAIAFAGIRLNDRLPEALAGQDVILKGYIADLPELDSQHVRFNFRPDKTAQNIPKLIRLTWYYPDKPVKAGQYWQFTARLKPPHGNFNPGGFDYERWLYVEGIGATGYVRDKPAPVLLAEYPDSISLLAWRQRLADSLDTSLSSNINSASIKALTIGDGSGISPQQWEVFRKTGTTHLMVISGSHVGLIAALFYVLTLKTWARLGFIRLSPQQAGAITATMVAFLYAGLTGFAVPAQRAALMIAIAMLALSLQRNIRPFHTLALALLAVLLIDPLVALLPGFWLSFTAVALIIYNLAGRLAKPGFWRSLWKINWVTSFGLMPLLLVFFQQVSLISPIANLIAVPVIGILIVPVALLAVVLMAILPALADKLFLTAGLVLQGLYQMLDTLADLPLATISHTQPSWWALVLAIPAVILLLAPKGIPSRWLALVMLIPLAINRQEPVKPGHFKLALLDVGQGLAAVVQTAQHALVYDTGAKFSGTNDAGQGIVIPYLRSQGVDKLDKLIVSHGDNDHIGGAASIMAQYPTEQLLTSVPQLLASFSPATCQTGQNWSWDGVQFSILSPKPGELSSENDNSCVLRIQGQTGTALLTGDIEADAEAWLVNTYGGRLKSDVLIAPHHGSQTSSTHEFLSEVRPKHVLIPAGYRNAFGHPHQDVIQRYRQAKINYLNIADQGAISAYFGDILTISSWREEAGRYWNSK
jgi:competence protein ComEC